MHHGDAVGLAHQSKLRILPKSVLEVIKYGTQLPKIFHPFGIYKLISCTMHAVLPYPIYATVANACPKALATALLTDVETADASKEVAPPAQEANACSAPARYKATLAGDE